MNSWTKQMVRSAASLLLLIWVGNAAAETALPYQTKFGMSPEQTLSCLNANGTFECCQEEEFFTYYAENAKNTVGQLNTSSLTFTLTANNANQAPELDLIDFQLPFDGDVIAAYRNALKEFTAIYGSPDDDPFLDVDAYVEYGTLSAYWTFDDARITLTMQRMYGDRINAYFTRRICYNADDLQ